MSEEELEGAINRLAEYYKDNLRGKNWGGWPDSSAWPSVGIAYTISQYESSGSIYDIIKFDSAIEVDGDKGRRFILSGQRVTNQSPVSVDGSIRFRTIANQESGPAFDVETRRAREEMEAGNEKTEYPFGEGETP